MRTACWVDAIACCGRDSCCAGTVGHWGGLAACVSGPTGEVGTTVDARSDTARSAAMAWTLSPSASRLTPRRKSLPSLRQFLVTAENCSRCHLMTSRDPTVKGRCTRMHAPDWDVSSSVPGTRKDEPLASCQQ